MIRLGIVGSRRYTNFSKFEMIINKWREENPKIKYIVSGGASGVDSMAEMYARKYKIPLRVFPARWKLYGRSAGPRRNAQIIEEVDFLIAFPSSNSVGTLDTIRRAKHKSIPHKIIYVDDRK